MTRFVLSAAARRDLLAIADHGRQTWGNAQALAYAMALESRLVLLAARPAPGRQRPELPDFIRSFAAESHVIFYTGTDSGIFVVRVLHRRQDAGRHLG